MKKFRSPITAPEPHSSQTRKKPTGHGSRRSPYKTIQSFRFYASHALFVSKRHVSLPSRPERVSYRGTQIHTTQVL